MSILTSLGTMSRSWKQWRRAMRAERAIGSLPFDVRKDIGWPDRYTAEIGRHPANDHFGR